MSKFLNTISISDIGQTITGKTPSSKCPNDFGEEYMFVTPSDSFDNKYISSTERYLSQEGIDKLNSKILPPLSIMVTCIGSAMGKVSMNKTTAITNQQINSIKISEKFDAHYIYYLLKNNYKLLRTAATGSTALPLLNKTDFDDLTLNATLNKMEQQKIANVLSSLDSKIELNNKINKELESMAKTLYDYWFVQFDFPDINGKPYKSSGGKMVYNQELKRDIPEGWEIKTLDTLTNIIAGGDKPKEFSEYRTSELSIPIYSNGIENEGLYGFTNNARINNPSITISARGTIGFCCLRFKPYLPIVRLISVTPKIQNQIVFFYQAIKNLVFENSGSVQQQLTVPQVSELKIVLPPELYLVKFEKIGISLFNKIENIKQQNQELAKLRDWLLPMLMNGQVRVK